MTELLTAFTTVAAWFWKEIGLLLTWILDQPILLLSMSLFFIPELSYPFFTGCSTRSNLSGAPGPGSPEVPYD